MSTKAAIVVAVTLVLVALIAGWAMTYWFV